MPAATRTTAIFDFDGTIIAGYSILAFLKERVRRRELGAADVARTAVSLAQSALGQIDSRELIARGMHEWNGRRLADLEALGERIFADELRELIFPEIRALVADHRRRGHVVAIATSAAPFQVEPVARELGVKHVLCTRLEARDGVLTGKSRGPILWGRAKADAVREFARREGIDLKRSHFYADGDEDVALMQRVGHPHPTNPRADRRAQRRRVVEDDAVVGDAAQFRQALAPVERVHEHPQADGAIESPVGVREVVCVPHFEGRLETSLGRPRPRHATEASVAGRGPGGAQPVEVQEELPLIRQVRDEGVTVFIIEHIMAALMSISDRVLVMDQGAVIATGSPAEVTANPRVIEAYLCEEPTRA